MRAREVYRWEVGLVDGTVVTEENRDRLYRTEGGKVSLSVPAEMVSRVSFSSPIPGKPRHDIFIDLVGGERFQGRFGRGFIFLGGGDEYAHVAVTNRKRVTVWSSGKAEVSGPDEERS